MQPRNGTTYLTVDFNNPEALVCNWEAGSCTLDPDEIEVCVHTSSTAVLGGC